MAARAATTRDALYAPAHSSSNAAPFGSAARVERGRLGAFRGAGSQSFKYHVDARIKPVQLNRQFFGAPHQVSTCARATNQVMVNGQKDGAAAAVKNAGDFLERL